MNPEFQVLKSGLKEEEILNQYASNILRPNKFYIEDGTTSESSTSSSSMLCACCFNCKTASSTFATRYWLECCNRSLNWTNSITWSTVEWDLYITDTNARRSEDKSYIGY